MPSAHIRSQMAIRELQAEPLASPSYGGIEGLFTLPDIYEMAARGANWRTKDEVMRARKQMHNLLNVLYSKGQLVRYGPVELPGGRAADFVRWSSEIVYATVEHAPRTIKTPNGVYGRICARSANVQGAIEDMISGPGRTAGAARNDFELWETQDSVLAELSGGALDEERETERLRIELHIAQEKLEAALVEIHRLREHHARSMTREQFVQAVESALDLVA